MLRLASLIYTMASATLMGVFIVIALTAGYDTLKYIVAAAAIGAMRQYEADRLVAEVNQGGQLVEEVVRQIDRLGGITFQIEKFVGMRGSILSGMEETNEFPVRESHAGRRRA